MSDGLDKKVTLGLALTLALLLATGVYWLTEASRQQAASDKFSLSAAEIFAQECFYCHGAQGTGGVGPSLRETKLDEEGLRRTISRGVVIMPAWAREEGGTLTPFQIQGLAAFIITSFILTIIGLFSRGEGMALVLPWRLPPGGLSF